MSKSSAQLEREAERTRSELAATLEELRSRITPGQLVDQTLDYARETNMGEFVRNLGRDARDNPLPLALMGIGLAWLMVAKGRRGRSGDGYDVAFDDAARSASGAMDATMARARDTAQGSADWAADAGRSLGEGATSAAGRLSEQARSTADWASSTAATATHHASGVYHDAGAAAADTARRIREGTSAAGGSFIAFCRDQPLVLAGIGVALGALLGAALPGTHAENRLMGEASDEAKRRAGDLAAEQANKAASAARDFPDVREANAPESSVVPTAPGEHAGH